MDNTATASPRQPGLLYTHCKQCERSFGLHEHRSVLINHVLKSPNKTHKSSIPHRFANESERKTGYTAETWHRTPSSVYPCRGEASRESAAATAERYWGGFGAYGTVFVT